jgi:hypothetical protein
MTDDEKQARPAMHQWQADDGWHIDVRGLPPPQPFVAIVRLLEQLPVGAGTVIVHHERDPLLLYPELAERGWSAQRVPVQGDEFRLRLTRLA